MKLSNKRILLAGLLATVGFAAVAQTAAPAGPADGKGPGHDMQRMGGMHGGDPAKMQARMQEHAAKRQAALKAKLKITAAQEGAWTTFTAAMKPPAMMMDMKKHQEERAAMEKLTTPERIDKMRAMRTERMTTMNANMDKRADATKAFYAVLTSEQKAVFDAVTMHGGREGGRGHDGMGGMGMGGRGEGHGRMGMHG